MGLIPERYSRRNFRRAIRNPALLSRELRRVVTPAYPIVHWPQKAYFESTHNGYDDTIAEDWDNLFILDACRYDTFEALDVGNGTLESRVIDSSTSEDFIDECFLGNTLHDTVYVTANPHSTKLDGDTFHQTISTITENRTEAASWSPEVVQQAAVDAYETYPDKRIIVHFMQPHAPYFGEKAEELRADLEEDGYRFWAWESDLDINSSRGDEKIKAHLLAAAQDGLVSAEELEEVYIENIEHVLEYVEPLAETLGGKSVITSDHGEMLGESRLFVPSSMGGMRRSMGHGTGIYTPELREVPWFTLQHTGRRETRAEEPRSTSDNSDTDVDDQLRALGYKT